MPAYYSNLSIGDHGLSCDLQERMVSPPDLPPPEMYKTLGHLLQQVDRGQKFRPVTVKEIAAANAKNAPKVLVR